MTYGLRELAQKGEKVLLVLTEGLWWLELHRREVVGEVRRRAGAEFGDGVGTGVLRAPGLHGSMCGVPAKLVEESVWPERHRLRPIATADEPT